MLVRPVTTRSEIVYDSDTPSWTLEQEKWEFYFWTLAILLGILPALVCQIPALRTRIEIHSHAVEGRAYHRAPRRHTSGAEARIKVVQWINREARGMIKHYLYLRRWETDEIERRLRKAILK